MLIAARSEIAAKARGVSAEVPDMTITKPRPWPAPWNSATTAPTTASETATLRPTKICGIAQGKRNLTKCCRFDADSDRATSLRSAGVELNPAIPATTIGKKLIRTTMTTRGNWPNQLLPDRGGRDGRVELHSG